MNFSTILVANVGDVVFYLHKNKVRSSRLLCIKIFIANAEPESKIEYVVAYPDGGTTGPLSFNSGHVFATKQELLESL